LGKDYKIKASMGHVRDLPKSKLGVDVKHDFKPTYEVTKPEVVNDLKKAGRKAKLLVLAMDPDREGEAIAYHVRHVVATNNKQQTTNNKFLRITFHEITKSAVEKALGKPGKINMRLVNAQQARRVLDRLVGYKLSPLLWRKVRRGLSAGRVQSVAVRLIVEREKEIEKFKPEEYWVIEALLRSEKCGNAKNAEFAAQLIKINDKKGEVKNKKQADKIVGDLKKAKYKVRDVLKRELRRSPPPPYITSTLQRACANLFHWSSKKTMREAQRLYEAGHITYHRTDSFNLSKQAVSKVRKFIEKKYGKEYLPEGQRFFKKKSKMAQEAHEAIRPTDIAASGKWQVASGKTGRDGQKLYSLIAKRFAACQMAAEVVDKTDVFVAAGVYLLKASGEVQKFEGWKILYKKSKIKNQKYISKIKNNKDEAILPELAKDEKLQLIKVFSEQKFTQPPARYSEASLIKTLEKLGIGRPSTYAPTISTIRNRKYVEKKEGKFHPTPVGEAVTKFLIKYFDKVMDYQFTAQMEEDLDKIAEGKRKWVPVVSEFYKPFKKKVKNVGENAKRVKIEVEKTGKRCPECKKGDEVIRIGRFGKFLSCSRFPKCKYTKNYVEKVGMKCPKCKKGDVIVRKTKKGRQFFGCSRYPKCKWAAWRKPQKKSSKGRKSRKGRKT